MKLAPRSSRGRRNQRLEVEVLLGFTLAARAIPGCDESGPRVYTAQRHSLEAGCLEAYTAIGLVEAEALSALCAPVCLSLGEDVYVSTLCPPYPGEASLEAADSKPCAAALDAPSCDELVESPDAEAP